MNNQTVRGVRDLIGDESAFYQKIISLSQEIVDNYGYKTIMLPIFEYSEIFYRTLGDTSDIVTKETYTFSDRDKRLITLRPEFTASNVRALISNGLTQQLPQRFFTYGPLFRHERPQLGRYRQFYQLNCEFFGNDSPMGDLEMIMITMSIIEKLNLKELVKLEINTLGDVESMSKYKAALIEYFSKYKSDLSEISQVRLKTNPLRILDSKNEKDQEIVQNSPNIIQYLNESSLKHYENLCELLEYMNIKYSVNNKLVRGLDYYTGTVFEITTDALGAQNAVCAGGRYDNLVEMMGGPSIPAIGFAMGIDRIYEIFKKINNIDEFFTKKESCYIVPIGEIAEKHAIVLARKLRKIGITVFLDYNINTKKRMKLADKNASTYAIIFGDDEINDENYILRDMKDSKETIVSYEELRKILK